MHRILHSDSHWIKGDDRDWVLRVPTVPWCNANAINVRSQAWFFVLRTVDRGISHSLLQSLQTQMKSRWRWSGLPTFFSVALSVWVFLFKTGLNRNENLRTGEFTCAEPSPCTSFNEDQALARRDSVKKQVQQRLFIRTRWENGLGDRTCLLRGLKCQRWTNVAFCVLETLP